MLLQPEVAAVYNLSVEGVPEYFANGILVHNCDSTRMVTAEWGPLETPLTEDERMEAALPAGAKRTHLERLTPEQRAFAVITRDYEIAEYKKQRSGHRETWAGEIVSHENDPWKQLEELQGRL